MHTFPVAPFWQTQECFVGGAHGAGNRTWWCRCPRWIWTGRVPGSVPSLASMGAGHGASPNQALLLPGRAAMVSLWRWVRVAMAVASSTTAVMTQQKVRWKYLGVIS